MNPKTVNVKGGIKTTSGLTGDAPALDRGAQGVGGQPPRVAYEVVEA